MMKLCLYVSNIKIQIIDRDYKETLISYVLDWADNSLDEYCKLLDIYLNEGKSRKDAL